MNKGNNCPNCKGEKSILINDGHSKSTKVSCPTCKGAGVFFRNTEKIRKIEEWQHCDYVHQLTCGSGTCNHISLIPVEIDYQVVLKCPQCGHIQTFIPESVLLTDIQKFAQEQKEWISSFRKSGNKHTK